MTPGLKLMEHEDDINSATKWWSTYPDIKFLSMARPRDTFSSYTSDVFERPHRLARSASMTNLTYTREAETTHKIRRAPSVSSLSPSHALAYEYRVPHRYISSSLTKRTDGDSWYGGAYAPFAHREAHKALERRPRVAVAPMVYSGYTPHFTMLTQRIFFAHRSAPSYSYVQGSQRYMDRYVNSRLRADNFALPFVHNTYDSSRSSAHRFNRHVIFSNTFITPSIGMPKLYQSGRHVRRVYKSTGRFYGD